MATEHAIGRRRIRLVRGDITTLDVDAFVFYARPDLSLGSGFGTAIAVRGGPTIQEQLRALGPREVGDVVVTTGGNLKARHIVHVVGPRFREPDLERKLHDAVARALQQAEAHGCRQLALPAMGAGFYGIPLEVSAAESLGAASLYLVRGGRLEEIIFCLLDSREFEAYEAELARTAGRPAEPATHEAAGGAA